MNVASLCARTKAVYGPRFWLDVFLVFSLTWLGAEVVLQSTAWRLAFNHTASIPRGVYIVRALEAHEVPRMGQIACFSYQEPKALAGRNYFPQGSALCKPVAVVAGESILREGEELLRIDEQGARTKLAQVAVSDSRGRPMPELFKAQAYQLQRGEYALVAGAKPNSLDTRFLGVFQREQLLQTAKPIFTFD